MSRREPAARRGQAPSSAHAPVRASQLREPCRLASHCGNRALAHHAAGAYALLRQPAAAAPPAALPAQTAPAERELDAKWNVDTTAIDPALADRLLALPFVSVAIYEAYETGLANDKHFTDVAEDFARTYRTVGLRTGGKGGPAVAVGAPIAVRERGDLSQAIQAIHRTMHRLAEGKRDALAAADQEGPAPFVRVPLIESVAIFAHGIRKGLGIDPEGEKGSAWLGIGQVKSFVAAIRGAVAGNVRFLLFACSSGASETEAPGMPAAGATGGEGSFAAALASELGGEATVYAHNVKGHLASNPLARVFTADSPSGRNMFDVLYPPAFLSGEAGRLRRDHTAIVGELDESALTAGLRRTAWLHYTDAVEADYYRINTKNRHFTIGGIGGVGAAMFMDPAGTAAVLQADFANVWLTPARIQGLR